GGAGLRWVLVSASRIFSGSVEPARLSASAKARKLCMLRALVSSRSRPVLALYISLILEVVLPGLPMSQALRFIAPWATSATAGRKEGAVKTGSSPITNRGEKSRFFIVLLLRIETPV